MTKKLYRNPLEALLGGVCAGLGSFLGINPVYIRILFVLWAVTGGSAWLFYLVLWIIIPIEGEDSSIDLGKRIKAVGQEISSVFQHPNSQLVVFAGIGLIGMGIFFLLRQAHFPWLHWEIVGPSFLVLAGILILFRALTGKN